MKEIRLTPLGGLGEVGMNCMLLETDTQILMIDCGILFSHSPWMGFDYIIPSFEYIKSSHKEFLGVVITHGHEDHLGALPHLCEQINVPCVWISPFAADIVKAKMKERATAAPLRWHLVNDNERYTAGELQFEFVNITHSIIEAYLLAIHTPYGVVVHSGDFKIDDNPYWGRLTNIKKLEELAQKGVLLLMADSTNSEVVGRSPSDTTLPHNFEREILATKGWVVFGCFASHIERVQMVMDVAKKCGRKVYINGKSMQTYFQLAINHKHLKFESDLTLTFAELMSLPREKVMIITSGTQGEFTSSMIRMSMGEHLDLQLQKEDRVIFSALKIPGNELNINFMFNQFAKLGVEVVHEKSAGVHVSGHGYQEDQKSLAQILKPKYFMPIHGELRMLQKHAKHILHDKLCKQSFVIEDGNSFVFDCITNEVKTDVLQNVSGKSWISGKFRGDLQDDSLRQKKRAAREGILFISCLIQDHQLMSNPQISFSALLTDEETRIYLAKKLSREIEKLCEDYSNELVKSDEVLKEKIATLSRKVCNRELGCKPLVQVHFV